MKTKEKTLLRFLSSADRYDPDKLDYDKQLVTDFYNSNGYPEFRFVSAIAQLSINKNNSVSSERSTATPLESKTKGWNADIETSVITSRAKTASNS